ncbi:MAG: UDP-N-acetylmuramate--L-alanine ligase [Treponema sp.]|nr:UDP-N-acetylmuramate--L-alanine ligase [Treponema sp.]
MLENTLGNLRGKKIHLVGIKGTGMAAFAEILFRAGAEITGSDVSERFYTDEILEGLGIVPLEFAEKNVTRETELVIHSSAYGAEKNPDLAEASRLGVPTMLYTEALGAYSEAAFSAGISGVHGKTSTTALSGTVLRELDLPCQVLAGSLVESFGSKCTFTSPQFDSAQNGTSRKKYFVAETCEYKRHFMSFCPKIIVLTSVESDHQDCFPTLADIQNAFIEYILKLPQGGTLIFCADDEGAKNCAAIAKEKRSDIALIPYGENASGEFRVEFKKTEDQKNNFFMECLGDAFLRVPGKHEVLDAAAAVALAFSLLREDGKNPLDFAQKIKDGLEKFSGGKRRSEILGRAKNSHGDKIIFIDDYGHHPTAIRTTLAGYKEFFSQRKIVVDFMSHTYSRTEALLDDFAKSFEGADTVIINKIYASAREAEESANVSGEILASLASKYHKDVRYKKEFEEAASEAEKILSQKAGAEFPNGYLFVTMGAGDNWKVGKEVLEKMQTAF